MPVRQPGSEGHGRRSGERRGPRPQSLRSGLAVHGSSHGAGYQPISEAYHNMINDEKSIRITIRFHLCGTSIQCQRRRQLRCLNVQMSIWPDASERRIEAVA